jgi:hypothetical protein
MKIFFQLGFAARLVFGSLLAGIVIGFYLGMSAASHIPSNDRAAVTDSRSISGPQCRVEEVKSWSRTSGSSCSAGS